MKRFNQTIGMNIIDKLISINSVCLSEDSIISCFVSMG